jgi:hypothetical protein
MRWALINNQNEVSNVIIWDGQQQFSTPEGMQLLQLNDDEGCGPGYSYDENSSPRFTAPPPRICTITFTSYQFLTRFTTEERTTIRSMAKTDDMVADFLMLATSAQEIINTDPTTLSGMDYIVSVGIIDEQRKKEILNFPY